MLARGVGRARRAALIGLAGLIALGLGGALAAFAIAARTDRAFDQHLARAAVGDLVVNPSLATGRAAEIIAGIDGVISVASDDLLTATLDGGSARRQIEVDSSFVHVRTSLDGRYLRQDRPVVRDGRMLRDGFEAVVNTAAADELGIEVGDRLPLAFWYPSYNVPGIGPGPDDVVEPIGRTEVTVVGIVVFADEVLADQLYPLLRVLVSPDAAAPFTCVLGDPTAVDGDTVEALATIVSEGCSLSYRYTSVRVAGGRQQAIEVADGIAAAFEEENRRLPTVALENNIGYEVIPSFTEHERIALDRAHSPGVTALRLFGTTAGLATVVLALLGAFRVTRWVRPDAIVWRQLGVAGRGRAAAVAVPLVAAVAAGAAGAVAVGWVASGLGPIGSAALLEVGTRRSVPIDVLLLVGGSCVAVLVAGVLAAIAAGLASPPIDGRAPSGSRADGMSRALRPAAALGVRAATSGASALVVLLGGVVAVAVVAASVVFAGNVSTLLRDPARFGWPYDVAVVIGFGYGGGDDEAIAEALDRPEVERWGTASMGTLALDGRSVAGIAGLRGLDELGTSVLRGRAPTGPHEIAVGTQTLDELDVDLDDSVMLSSTFGDRRVAITGTVVLPAIGPYESSRAESGRGALLPPALYEALVADAEARDGLEPGSLEATGFTGFVAVELADGVDPETFLAAVGDRRDWDNNDFNTLAVVEPLRPAALEEASTVRDIPVALGVMLAAAMAGGMTLGLAAATRGREHELAILRTLGCTGGELRRTVRWHAATVILAAALLGGPVGVAAGRVAARSFLGELGVSDAVVLPVAGLAIASVAILMTGVIATVGPARRATSVTASTGQRT